MKANDIIQLAKSLNIPIIIIVILFVFGFCVLNAEKLFLVLSKFQSFFTKVSSKARKGTIANSIRGNVLKSSKAFQSLGQDVLIPDLKIKWVKEESPEAFIKNNQVIIRMSQSTNPYKNYVTAVNTYVNQALLPKAKNYIDSQIYNMSSLSVCRLLILNGDSYALDYFDDKILNPIINNDVESNEIFDQLKTIDKNGMFINILINEYSKAARQVYPDKPDPQLIAESRELLNFLYRIALGITDDAKDLVFNREYFKIDIFLTANTETLVRSGKEVYIKRMSYSISQGIKTLYVFGLGRKIETAEIIVKELKENDYRVTTVRPHHYRHRSIEDGRSIHGVCYEVCAYKDEVENEI